MPPRFVSPRKNFVEARREIRSCNCNDTTCPAKGEREREEEGRNAGRGGCKVSRRRRKFVIYKINIRQLFLGPPLVEKGWCGTRQDWYGQGRGEVVKTAIAKTRNAETRNPAESLEFTAPTYWLRKHTKLRLVKHSPDTCPTPACSPPTLHCPFLAILYLVSEMFDG